MTVPKNVLVQFPSAWVPFKEFAANKEDFIGFEAFVQGNTINGVPRVAQIQIWEFFTGLAFGFVESVDFADGSMKIENGPNLRINDPNGVFSVGNPAVPVDGSGRPISPLMTADDQSPSITAYSGFPMCIPRNDTDPLCALSQRPFAGPGIFTAPDPLVAAPFQAGDYIQYLGYRRGNEVIAYSIVAQNVQINTLGDVAYVRMELALLGISNPSTNVEIAESRFIGYTSNNRATAVLYARDINPCTGVVTNRILAAVPLRGGANEQNKFIYQADLLSRYTREYYVELEVDGIVTTFNTKNGFRAGTYITPVTEWVQGEQNIPGTQPPAMDFSNMAFLTRGVGPDADGNIWGPLDPFPQTGVLAVSPC
ncbi:hypothetical protein N0V93_006245 [Gnomoniopsis smithogilvyi]|uniref:Uncharacterized protein n=1 Tax=Gnomoniopsis smithogilvyi TaxID=1191159 RepID=A0A9W8YRJ2_9PEZI|nr:hypothetical protein N0V93_006245 [Gnomoniopsis smithogilvyi]